jgi:hypothetical protein
LEYRQQKHSKEVDTLQRRLEASEVRNEEMTMLNNDATKPLLRQIESMREKQQQSMQDWDQIEQGLQQRIKDIEREKINAAEQNNMMQSKLTDMVL